MWYRVALEIEKIKREASESYWPDGYFISTQSGEIVKLPRETTHANYMMDNKGEYVIPQGFDPEKEREFLPQALVQNNLIRSRHFTQPVNSAVHGYEFPSDDYKVFQMAQKHYLDNYATNQSGKVILQINGKNIHLDEPLDDWHTAYMRHKK